jgi:rRNA maturation endonuclease Nob1
MNATQRKFLIDRIKQGVDAKIKALRELRQEYPSVSNYLFKAVMNDEVKLQDREVMLAAIKEKALKAKEGVNWLSESHMGWEKSTTVKLKLEDVFILPEDYTKEVEAVTAHNAALDKQISELLAQVETLEVRIQLSSDKTLQKVINEVDDMGDISLIDTKIKGLNQ